MHRRPHQIKKKRSILKNKFFWLFFSLMIILGIVFYLIVFFEKFQIKKIEISGNKKVSSQRIENFIQQEIKNDFFSLFSKSIFLADLKKINRRILEEFPEIEKTELKKDFPEKISIKIQERIPFAVFFSGENIFFLDKQGIIFEIADSASLQMLKIQNQIQTDQKPTLGMKVIDEKFLSLILEIEAEFKNLKIPIEEILIISNERINVKTKEGWEIYFNPKENLDWQIIKLKVVLEKKISLEKRKELKYIDLRFEKVYIFPETN